MTKDEFNGITMYVSAVWGRELSKLQQAGGWKLLHELDHEDVEQAVTAIAERGDEHIPSWSLVLKTARSSADARRQHLPALPASDSLSDQEHRGVMIELRARESDEQRRRADRMTGETKHLAMKLRIKLASELLATPAFSQLPAVAWDKTFDRRVAEFGVPA